MRRYSYARTLHAGCFTCNGSDAKWFGNNAQGVAARHHDATGHPTWVDVSMSIFYGEAPHDAKEATKTEGLEGIR
jgi:hypothetical protein